ncbi:MAG TPA: hypothetical protein VGM43_20680 [Bryobacteraceae bacterium]
MAEWAFMTAPGSGVPTGTASVPVQNVMRSQTWEVRSMVSNGEQVAVEAHVPMEEATHRA